MSNIKDIQIQQFPVKIGDKTFLLQYDMFAFSNLEEIYGTVSEALESLEKGSVKVLLDLLWAGAVGQDPSLDRLTIGKGLSFKDFTAIQETLMKAIMAGLPDMKQPENPNSVSDELQLPMIDGAPEDLPKK